MRLNNNTTMTSQQNLIVMILFFFSDNIERSVSLLRSEMDGMLKLLQEIKRSMPIGNITFDKIKVEKIDFESRLPFQTPEEFISLDEFLLEDKNTDSVVK